MIDIDDFKKYNDRFGHVAGDIVLKTVAQILTEVFKEPGTLICRYGGEEFVIILPDCPRKEAVKLAEQVRDKIETFSIILRREKTRVTVSVGVAALPEDAKKNLVAARLKFSEVLAENLRMIEAARKTGRRLVEKIISAARDSVSQKTGYTAAGKISTTADPHKAPVSIRLNDTF